MNDKYSYNSLNNVDYSSQSNIPSFKSINGQYMTFTNIIPNLYVGNRDDLLEHLSYVNVVIDSSFKNNNLNKVNPEINNRDYHKLNLLNYKEIIDVIAIIDTQLQKNRKIFVYCDSGFYFSGFVVACYFIKYAKLNKFNVINCLQSINPLYFSQPLKSSMDLILDELSC